MSRISVLSNRPRRQWFLVVLLIVVLLTIMSSTTAQDVTPTELPPTEASTTAPIEPDTPVPTDPAAEAPTEAVSPVEPTTETPSPVEVATETPATDATTEPPLSTEDSTQAPSSETPELLTTAPVINRPRPQLEQTFCKLSINDLGDDNPFTYRFAAVDANHIASFAWDLDDGTTGSMQTIDHTYAAANVYNISLTCIPEPGFGDPIVLKGSISITSAPVADFTLSPATMITGLPPFQITTVNTSTGGALTYNWNVTDDSHATIYNATSENISYTFPTYGTFWFELTVTDGAGLSASKSQSVSLNAPPPTARFTLTPGDGTSPLSVTVLEDDLQSGPIDTLTWDFGDGSPAVTGPGPHSHTYTLTDPDQEETFTIILSYSGPGGSGTFSREVGVYPGGDPVFAVFETETMTSAAGGMEICFRNLSTGPIAFNRWDFDNDGTFDLVSSDALVCHVYASEATYFVRLRVENAAGSSTSTASNIVSVVFAPVAAFSVSPGTSITWSDLIDLDSSGSTGAIDTWEWDFNGDGIIDSTEENPQNISLTKLGNNPIRLTVTGPGGSSTAEAIVFVARLDITCDFTGMLDVLPTAGEQTYTSVIGSQGGRDITYAWTITGGTLAAPLTFDTAAFTLDWADYGAGAFVVRLDASTLDGSECSTTKTVTRTYPALNCLMTADLPATLYADGSTYTFTADVQNLASRPIISFDWSVNGVSQGVDASIFTRSWSTPPVAPVTETVRYTVVVDDGGGQTSSCYEEQTVTINPWPEPTCSLTSDLPGTLYADGRTYNFDANVGNLFGRSVTAYRWYVDGVLQSTMTADTPFTWTNITDTSLIPYSDTIRVEVEVDNNNGTTSGCSASITATVNTWPTLTCSGIGGQANPIPALPDNPTRSYTYTANVSGVANRTVVYTWTVDTGTITTTNPRTNDNRATIRWPSSASARTPGLPSVIGVNVVVTNPDGTTANTTCGLNRTVNVQVPALTCNLPSGDSTPVLNETNSYTMNLVNRYGRAFTSILWELEYYDGTDWQPVTSDTGTAFSYQFINPNVQYRLRYTADVSGPTDGCTSQWYDLNTYNDGVDFFCDAFPAAGNNFSPASASSSYAYTVDMDNGNGLNLLYTWVLVGPGSAERVLGTSTSLGNGLITGPALLGSAFSPVGNYTLRVDVEAQDPADSSYTCSLAHGLVVGTLDVNYSYTGEGGAPLNNSAVAVGQPICITNNSSTSHGDISQLLYQWDISAASGNAANNTLNETAFSGQQLPGCIAFNEPGEYTIQLQGRNDSQGDSSFSRSANHSVTFFVYGLQNIAINRSNATFAPATINFQAVGTNITSNYSWQFINRDTDTTVGNRTGINVSQYFGAPGNYRAIVSGSGPLGVTTAQADFTLLAANQLRAAFVPSVYGGVAPMTVCFTDRSVGNNIQSWMWDFGNGETLTYTPATIPSSICTTYVTPATAYSVRLTISNGTLTETATNTVRTYNLLESSATFSVTPRGGGEFCFTAILEGGVSVTGWDYGDGITGPAQNIVCHSFSASGTYLVSMHIEDSSGIGTVVRPVVVDLSGGTNPVLAVTGLCSADRTATFTVTNTGGAMTSPDQVIVRDRNGVVILIDSLMLAANASQNYVISNQSGAVTFSTVDFGLTAATTCNHPPEISVAAVCGVNSLPVFTVSNNRPADGPMIAPQAYEIQNSTGTVVASGTFQLIAGETSETNAVPAGSNPYDTYTFVSSGAVGSFNVGHACAAQPALNVTTLCGANPSFTITNTSPNDMVLPQAYTITNGAGTTVNSGSIQLAVGASQTVTLTGLDPYAGYSLTSSGFAGNYSANQTCTRPDLVVSSVCGDPLTFTIENRGGDMLVAQPYTITDASSATVASGSLQLAAGASDTISLDGLDPYLEYTFNTAGFAGDRTIMQDCANPAFTVTSTCADPVTFTITNNVGDMLSPQDYTVRSSAGDIVLTGNFQLAAGASETVTLTGLDPYAGYSFQSSGFAGIVDTAQSCQRPTLSVSATCTDPATFVISNSGGDMLSPQVYRVTNRLGTVVQTGDFQLAAGADETIILTGLNPYGGYRIEGSDFAGTINEAQTCVVPSLELTTSCTTPSFTVTNRGGDMLTRHAFRLTSASGANLTPANNTFQLRAGRSLVIPSPDGADLIGGVTFSTNDLGITTVSMLQCLPPAGEPPVTGSVTSGAKVATVRTTTGDWLRFNGLSSDLLKLPAWDSVPTCGYGCPTFRLYHTDETRDWEIFRLDGADEQSRTYERHNLTFGEGDNITDMSPSLSPNNDWIIFTSNRDGNWELYVAATSGDPDSVQRVTYNTIAIDTDPMWGPNNYVVFESSRNGNWDLYLLDMNTGLEYRLTDNDADDINPFWSPDGSKIVFQSSRDPVGDEYAWQIFELDLRTQTVTRLSDGSHLDVDPQYSSDGQHIVYRTYDSGNANSVIAVMDADGRNTYTITAPSENATNAVWSPQDHFIAYQSDLDGDLDIYVYDVTSRKTRKLTDNRVGDYAPTWLCDESRVMFTSDSTGNPDIFEAEVQPISAPPIVVEDDAEQLTFETSLDIYPQNTPSEENASREGQTVLGPFGQQTLYLFPDVSQTPVDHSLDDMERDDWDAPTSCPLVP